MQNSVNYNMPEVYDGKLHYQPDFVVSGIAKADIYGGKALTTEASEVTPDAKPVSPYIDGDVFAGVSIADITVEQRKDDVYFQEFDVVPILKEGYIWVEVADELTNLTDPVCVRTVDGGTPQTRIGAFNTVAGTGLITLSTAVAKWEAAQTTNSKFYGLLSLDLK